MSFGTRCFSRSLQLLLVVVLCTLVSSAQQFATATYDAGPNPLKLLRGDFNHDGHEDIAAMNGNSTVSVLLNNGDGTFHRVDSAGGNADIVSADFNRDGRLDLAMISSLPDGTGNMVVMLGRGDGTFDAPTVVTNRQGAAALAVGDFNGDGNQDIAIGWNQTVTVNGSGQTHANVSVLFGNGSGGFGSTAEIANAGAQADYANGESGYQIRYMNSGDFDGDGKTDFAIAECCGGFDVELGATYTYTSNGNGTFTAHALAGAPPLELRVADVNNDGKTDLLMPYSGCHTPCYGVFVYTDSINGPSTGFDVPDAFSPLGEADGFNSATAADFTGSGIKNVAYLEFGYYWGTTDSDQMLLSFAASNSSGGSTVTNTFNPGPVGLKSLIYADWNKDGKNDLAAIYSPNDGSPGGVAVYTNVGGPSVPTCVQPGSRQMNICAPVNNSTVPGPLRVYAAFNSNSLQSVQIYVDGVKKYEKATTFAYAVDTTINVPAGTHKITVKAWDASGSFSATSYATVGSGGSTGGGGGSGCSASANRSVNICAPTSGSTEASPVQVLAGLRSDSGVTSAQIYVDGTKAWQGPAGTTTVNQSLQLAPGSHKITVKGWDSAGSFSSSVTITVSGTTGCSAVNDRTVSLCSPAQGSTVSNPVQVIAALKSSKGITAAQIYLDSVKIWQGGSGTTSINQSFTIKSGNHFLTVKGWDSSGSFSNSATFTVP